MDRQHEEEADELYDHPPLWRAAFWRKQPDETRCWGMSVSRDHLSLFLGPFLLVVDRVPEIGMPGELAAKLRPN